jgi:choline kinase
MNNVSIIIPVAGIGKRMRSYGPKASIRLNDNETVISRQLRILNNIYPMAEFVLVLGFEASKVEKEIPKYIKNIKIVYNHDYEETNVAYSLGLGAQAASSDNLLIVYGDLVFNIATFDGFYPFRSMAIIDKKGYIGKQEVGLTTYKDAASIFSYGLPTKWAQIVYLTDKEADMFKRLSLDKAKRKLFGFELLNNILLYNGEIAIVEPENMKIAEIDTSKDIDLARKIVT